MSYFDVMVIFPIIFCFYKLSRLRRWLFVANIKCEKIGQGLLLTGDPHVMVVPPKYFFHAINVQQLIYVLYNFDEIALSHMVKEIQVYWAV